MKKRDSIKLSVNFSSQEYNLIKTISLENEDYLSIEDSNIELNFEEIEQKYRIIEKNTKNISRDIISDLNSYDLGKYYKNLSNGIVNTIGPITSLEYLVQNSFKNDPTKIEEIQKKVDSLKNDVFCWRRISGDGNCFYRATMFSYLEYLILNRKVINLKNICLEIEGMNLENNNFPTKINDNDLKNQYNFSKDPMKGKILNILFLIIREIEYNFNEYSIKKAHVILIKSLIYFKSFDYTLIKYLRYLLYLKIDSNKDKIYHKNYEVKLGNLLPIKYEISDDNFNFQLFYEVELLPLYKEAEMIVVNIIPFVLKMNLSVLTYDFSDSDEKMQVFSCFLPIKPTINVIYKSGHYDIFYDQQYFMDNLFILSGYSDNTQIKDLINSNLAKINENKKIKEKTDCLVIDNYIKIPYEHNQIFINNFTSSKNTCLKCKNNENLFQFSGECRNCLRKIVKEIFRVRYMEFIEFSKTNIIDIDLVSKLNKKQQEYFCEKPVQLNSVSFSINNIENMMGESIQDFIVTIKSEFCINCGNNHKDDFDFYEVKFQCSCYLLSKNCEFEYFQKILNNFENSKKIICFCSENIRLLDLRQIYNKISNSNKDEDKIIALKQIYKKFGDHLKTNYCCICRNNVGTKEHEKLIVKENEAINENSYENISLHKICSNCIFEFMTEPQQKEISCKVCDYLHQNYNFSIKK